MKGSLFNSKSGGKFLRTPRQLRITIFLFLFFLITGSVFCHAGTLGSWKTLENDYFLVYTDAHQRDVTGVLQELEKFRSATTHLLKIDVPAAAPKTIVVVFRRWQDFRSFVGSDNIGGIQFMLDTVPTIVMPLQWNKMVKKSGRASKSVIRHEYVHVLQAYHRYKFPHWYNEGLAELFSSLKIYEDHAILGRRPLSRSLYVPADFDYASLFLGENDFDSNEVDAYAHYWLFTHYLLLGERKNKELAQYLASSQSKSDDTQLFRRSFGVEASELWKKLLRDYAWERHVVRVELPFEDLSKFSIEDRNQPGVEERVDAILTYQKEH